MPRPVARRIVLAALALGVAVDVLVPGNAAGLNAPLVVALSVLAAFGIAGRAGLRRLDHADVWMPPAAFGLAAAAMVRADPWLVEADLLFAAALVGATVAALSGVRITRGLVPDAFAAVGEVMAATLTGAIDTLGGLRAPLGADQAATADRGESRMIGRTTAARTHLRRLAPIGRGVVLAVPLVALFALLFSSADAVFATLARSALDWRVDVDLGVVATRAFVVAIVAWTAAGLMALAAGRLPRVFVAPGSATAGGSPSLGAANVADLVATKGLGTIEATTILAAVDVLFAAFVVLQLAYLFGGRDTLAIAGLTYADYARRGFFELVAVAVLAGLLVVSLDLAVRARSRGQVATSLVLLGLTGLVLASAFVRLRLYQDAYGWTELRFLVIVAIGWLAAALAATAWLVVARQTQRTLHVLGILVLVALAGMNVVGPQAYVADRNLERAIDPNLVPPGGRSGLDAAYLASLGDEAVPAVTVAYDRLGPADRVRLLGFLGQRAAVLDQDSTLQGWAAFNLTRERARAAIAAWSAGR
jgi:hypothetical protein